MILAPTLTLNTSARGYDADATAFAAASGATDVAALSAFVKGIKELGLWNNMVCWPLRSSQNAGTGDTVYSLGGLGTYDGTRVNGPAWTADGLDINAATSQSIGINPSPLSDFANGHSWFVVMKPTGPDPASGTSVSQFAVTQSGAVVQGGAAGTGNASNFMVNARTATERHTSGLGAYASARNAFGFLAHNSFGDETSYRSTLGVFTDGGTVGSVNTYSGTVMNVAADGNGRNTSAFILVTTPQYNLSVSLQTALESLYKTTLGTGLGLP